MLTYLLYNRQTPGESRMSELAQQLEPLQVDTRLLDADSAEGINLVEHYDVMGRPAVLVCRDDGTLVQFWQGETEIPSASEISYLAHL